MWLFRLNFWIKIKFWEFWCYLTSIHTVCSQFRVFSDADKNQRGLKCPLSVVGFRCLTVVIPRFKGNVNIFHSIYLFSNKILSMDSITLNALLLFQISDVGVYAWTMVFSSLESLEVYMRSQIKVKLLCTDIS